MNGKKAKMLRKQAKFYAEDNNYPEVNYGHKMTQVRVMRMNSQGLLSPAVEQRVTVFLKNCERVIYQNFKKAFYKKLFN